MHTKSKSECISMRLFCTGVPVMMTRIAVGICASRCTSCMRGFFNLCPYVVANAPVSGYFMSRLINSKFGFRVMRSTCRYRTNAVEDSSDD